MRTTCAGLLAVATCFGLMSATASSANAVDRCGQLIVDKANPASFSGYIVQSCDGNTRIQYNIRCLVPAYSYSIVRTFPSTGATMRYPISCGSQGLSILGVSMEFV